MSLRRACQHDERLSRHREQHQRDFFLTWHAFASASRKLCFATSSKVLIVYPVSWMQDLAMKEPSGSIPETFVGSFS